MSDSTPTTPPDGQRRVCPACDADATDNVTASGYCRGCGHDLVSAAAPPAWRRGIDMRAIARYQRRVQYFVLAMLAVYGVSILAPLVMPLGIGAAAQAGLQIMVVLTAAWGVVSVIASIVAVVLVAQLATTMRFHIVRTVLYSLLALAPCFNILVLLSVSSQATAMLKLAGLKVGFFGVSDEQVMRLLSANRCRQCGYILMPGVHSPVCPECGAR